MSLQLISCVVGPCSSVLAEVIPLLEHAEHSMMERRERMIEMVFMIDSVFCFGFLA